MKITELALRRPALITVLFLAVFILGLFCYASLPADLLPRMEFPYVAVFVPYPGAGPQEVEREVTRPLEDAMSSLNNVNQIRSFSQEGMSLVWIEFKLDTDAAAAVNEVQRKYSSVVYELPVEAEPATIQQFNINDTPIMQLSVTGNLAPAGLYSLVENDIVPRLQQVKGVSRVMLLGGKEREIRVEIIPERLKAYRLSLTRLLAVLQGENRNIPAGKIEQQGQNFVVRVNMQVDSLEELGNIVVAGTAAGPVYLRDVARINDTFKEDRSYIRLNGQPGIGLLVFKRSDANTIETSRLLRQLLPELAEKHGINLSLAYDSAQFIQDSLRGVQEELLLAVLIVALVIYLFLGSWRSSLVILLSIPVSIIGIMVLVKLCGFSINLMTLMAAALVVGIVVDDSIVVLENIQRHLEKGADRVNAALSSSREIGVAVVGISLTLVIVFLPVALVPGIAGKIFREFGLVVVGATLLSLLVALALIPLLAARFSGLAAGTDRGLGGRLTGHFAGVLQRLSREYELVLRWALGHRKTVLLTAAAGLLLAAALLPLRLVGTEFIPKVDRGEFVLKLTAPPGTSLRQMDQIVRGIEREVRRLPDVREVFTSVGYTTGQYDAGESSNLAEVKVVLRERDAALSAKVKAQVQEIAGRRAGLESAVALTSLFGSAEDADLRLEVRGHQMDDLKKATEIVRQVVARTPGTRDVRTSLESGLPEYNIRLDREAVAAHGLFTGEVAQALGLLVNGQVVGKYSEGEEQYDVRLLVDEHTRQDTQNLAGLPLLNHTGQPVLLGQVAAFSQGVGLKKIERAERQRVFVVNANLTGRSLGDAVRDIKEKLAERELPAGVQVVFEGDQKMFEESMRDLSMAMLLSLIFVYLIMVAIFESFLLPLTIMFSVPLASIGALLALAVTGQTLNVFSMVGMIMLVGLVTKNAILLVDFANQLRQRGLNTAEALVRAGAVRLRPILMTTVSMIMAMLPLAIGLSTGSEMRRGMSVALIGGLLSSTLLTLLVVPVVFSLLDAWRERGRERKTPA